MPNTTESIQHTESGHFCPLCSKPVAGVNIECNRIHPAVLNSWTWANRTAYENWYTTPTYHGDQFNLNKGSSCSALYEECYRAAELRLAAVTGMIGLDKSCRILDVGAGNGAFVDVARSFGHEAYGIDPHPLREDIQQGGWEGAAGAFDVVTLFDVVEHLLRPYEALMHLKGCLAPGGLIVIETPEYEAPDKRWKRHIKPAEHVTLYSVVAAEELYTRVGLTVLGFYRPLRGTLGKMTHVLKAR